MPWTAFCGIFYSIANTLIGSSLANSSGSGSDDEDNTDPEKKDDSGKIVMGVMAAVTFSGILIISYFTKKELTRQLKKLDEQEKI